MRLSAIPVFIGLAAVLGSCGASEPQTGSASTTSPTTEQSVEVDCSGFAGQWTGTEDLGAEDEEGGIYRTRINLPSEGEATIAVSDTIEIFESWDCNEDEIILTDWQDNTLVLTVVNPDTLGFHDEELVRVAE